MSTKLHNIWDKAVLVGTEGSDEYKYTVSINPFFNYIADEYNQRNELNMVNGYVEYDRASREDPDSTESSAEAFPDTIENFTQEFAPESDDKSKRPSFINNSYVSRPEDGQSRMQSIFYFDDSVMSQEKYFRGGKGTDEISGYHPQAVKITLNSTVKPLSQGYLKKLINNFGRPENRGVFPFFVKSIIEKYDKINQKFDGLPSGVESESIAFNRITSDDLFYETFDDAYDNPINSCCPLSIQDRPEGVNGDDLWDGDDLYTIIADANNSPLFNTEKDEDLFFEILKCDQNDNVIQTFYTSFLTDEASSWSFYDTQVKVEKQYTYKIYSWRIISKNFSVFISKSTEPIFIQTLKITQPSLPVPDVSFETYKDDLNKYKIKILLNLNKNSENGKYYYNGFQDFVQMNADGSTNNETKDEWLSRKNSFDIMKSKPSFVYESQKGKFEIYKMSSQPQGNYQDINVSPVVKTSFVGTQLVHIDELIPFKKYYYVFRAINFYEYPSNPTDIYEVELFEDADEVFLNMKIVNFANLAKDKYKPFKSMMRMLQIIPSSNQTTFDSSNLLETTINTKEPITVIIEDKMYSTVGFKDDNGVYVTTGFYKDEYNQDEVIFFDDTPEEYKNPNLSQPLFTGDVSDVAGLFPYLNQELPTLGLDTVGNKIWTVINENGTIKETGEKFKIRIVSNDTGRKLDLNVRFLLKKN
tara:strand:- start:3805 stop:5898 length:2094 start_codon:yes stop_codon:yes gene_type:complete